MNYLYLGFGFFVLLVALYIQIIIPKRYQYILPVGFAILTFWFGFISLLFSFVLIFVAQLYPLKNPDQKE